MKLKDVWLAGNALSRPEEWHYSIPYYDKKGQWINYKIGDVIPVFQKHERTAFYEIEDIRQAYCGSDLSLFDDGRKYTLKLHHIE